MKAPEFRPFVREDFPSDDWADKLLRPLNQVLGQVRSGFGNGLTLGENLNAQVKVLDVTAPNDWTALTLTNSWTVYGGGLESPAYRLVGDEVQLRGVAKAGTVASPLATLPVGFRPAAGRVFAALCDAAASTMAARIDVSTAGSITTTNAPAGLTWVTLESVHFQTVSVPSALPSLVRFTSTVRGKVAGVWPLRVVSMQQRNEIPVTGGISVGWDQDGQTITIRSVSGLVPGATYRLTLAVLGG